MNSAFSWKYLFASALAAFVMPLTALAFGIKGTLPLKVLGSGKCLDVVGRSTANGAKVQQYSCYGGTNQTFAFTPVGTDLYQITGMHDGKCFDIDISKGTAVLGANLQQWVCQGQAAKNEVFLAIQISTNQVELQAVSSQMCLGVQNASVGNGALLIQEPCNAADKSQVFSIPAANIVIGTPTPTPSPAPTPIATPSPSPVQTPTPVASVCGSAPSYAQAAGFTRVDLEMNPNDPTFLSTKIGWNNEPGKDWYPGMWYEGTQDSSKIRIEDGALKINGAASSMALETIQRTTSAPTGRSWQYGYFEADVVMRNWTTFWMVAYNKAHGGVPFSSANPLSFFSELDFAEGDETLKKYVVSTVHRNTGTYGGLPDQANQGTTWNGVSQQVMDTRHKIGALWLADRVEIYLDRVKVNTLNSWDSNKQKHFLILSTGLGGANQGTPGTVNNPLNESWWYSVCVYQPK